jgi:hypothetical protein
MSELTGLFETRAGKLPHFSDADSYRTTDLTLWRQKLKVLGGVIDVYTKEGFDEEIVRGFFLVPLEARITEKDYDTMCNILAAVFGYSTLLISTLVHKRNDLRSDTLFDNYSQMPKYNYFAMREVFRGVYFLNIRFPELFLSKRLHVYLENKAFSLKLSSRLSDAAKAANDENLQKAKPTPVVPKETPEISEVPIVQKVEEVSPLTVTTEVMDKENQSSGVDSTPAPSVSKEIEVELSEGENDSSDGSTAEISPEVQNSVEVAAMVVSTAIEIVGTNPKAIANSAVKLGHLVQICKDSMIVKTGYEAQETVRNVCTDPLVAANVLTAVKRVPIHDYGPSSPIAEIEESMLKATGVKFSSPFTTIDRKFAIEIGNAIWDLVKELEDPGIFVNLGLVISLVRRLSRPSIGDPG